MVDYFNDAQVRDIADFLFGDEAPEVVSKMNPAQSDLATHRQRQAKIALATNVVGLTSGAAALGGATKKFSGQLKAVKGTAPKVVGGARKLGLGERVPGSFKPVVEGAAKVGTKVADVASKPKVALGVAGAGLGLQAANMAGDAIANRVLSRDAKSPATTGGATTLVHTTKTKIGKNFTPAESEIVWEGEFSKVDSDKRQVFGWASVVKKDGQDVVDLQGDYIAIDEIEKAAYDYVIKSRKGGNQHQRDGEMPLHVSDMIESFVVTPEKIEKMGLPEDTPLGWWCGFHINDDKTWAQVKNGERTGFSVHGRGARSAV